MKVTLNDLNYVRSHVRQVPDFPKKGILFLDITTATKDAKAFKTSVDFLTDQFVNEKLDTPIIINEYTDMARAFYAGPQVKIVNAVLDKIGKVLRG